MKRREYQKKFSLYGVPLEKVINAVLHYKPKKKRPKKKKNL